VARVRVSSKYQIAVPAEVRRKLGIEAGDTLLVDLQGDRLVLSLEPKDWAAETRGLHAEVWEGVDADDYLQHERNSWRK
jgi:antitoxin ChpS